MKFNRRAQGGLAGGVLGMCLGLTLATGCGNESTKPASAVPSVQAMAGIQIPRGTAPGTPYQAGAVVTVDGQLVTDAVVQINGAALTYNANPAKPEETGYIGLVSASQGDTLTLSVTAAGQTLTRQTTVPGILAINPPVAGFVYADDQDIPISWVPATGTILTLVACGGQSTPTPALWIMPPGTTQYSVPAAATTVPGNRISVFGINGSGDLPSTTDLSQWVGKNGFWVTCQDTLGVLITP